MPAAVATALRGHDVFSTKTRGRSRASSEVGPPPQENDKTERAQLSKAASYTYFPRVKGLGDDDLTRTKDADVSDSSSAGSSPSSEDAPPALEMPLRRPSTSARRSSRFLSFSRSREPSVERKAEKIPKAEKTNKDTVKETDSPSASPARSLSKLRRKSWIVSSQPSSTSSPIAEKTAPRSDENLKKKAAADANKRKPQTTVDSIPEDAEARVPSQDAADPLRTPITPLDKKNKRLSALLTANGPAVPSLPKSFSTDQLPTYPSHSPISPTHIPPLPRTISADKLKGLKTEPRKKDELWTVFRNLEADLRKYDIALLWSDLSNAQQIFIKVQLAESQHRPHNAPRFPTQACRSPL
jgi:hypothetical protein